MTFKGIYIGPIAEIQGQTAQLKLIDVDTIQAQFNDPSLGPEYTEGWLSFPIDNFLLTTGGN